MAGLHLLREMIGRILGRPWILIIIGAALILLATADLGRAPRCGGEALQPGDLCEYDSGRVTTYEDEVSENRIGGWVLAGGGLVLVCAGIYGLVRRRLHTDQAHASAADAGPIRQPPGGTPF